MYFSTSRMIQNVLIMQNIMNFYNHVFTVEFLCSDYYLFMLFLELYKPLEAFLLGASLPEVGSFPLGLELEVSLCSWSLELMGQQGAFLRSGVEACLPGPSSGASCPSEATFLGASLLLKERKPYSITELTIFF